MKAVLDCIIIGAGPGGLVCTKELLEQGIENIVCLERADRIGGVYNHAYDNLVLSSSCVLSMFSDFWIGDEKVKDFWTKEEALEYWHKYAKHFGVLDKVQLNSTVTSVRLNQEDHWEVVLDSAEKYLSKRVVVATGNNSVPKYPQWKESLTQVEVYHSHEYQNAEKFEGKNVLVVGGGESASDIALQISKVADHCWVSLRHSAGFILPRKFGDNPLPADAHTNRFLWSLPREYGKTFTQDFTNFASKEGVPLIDNMLELNSMVKAQNKNWGTYATKTASLPLAITEHECEVAREVSNIEDGGQSLTTADGKKLQDLDAVIFCTGYKNYVPFLPEDLKETDPRSLYKHIFHNTYRDKIAWIGWARPNFGSQFPIMELQARFLARIFAGKQSLPSPHEMEKTTSLERGVRLSQFERSGHKIRSLVDYGYYMDDLAQLIQCKPSIGRYLVTNPRLWLHLVFSPMQAIQFRLEGPGSKKDAAQEMLLKLPLGSLLPINFLTLKGHITQLFKRLPLVFYNSRSRQLLE